MRLSSRLIQSVAIFLGIGVATLGQCTSAIAADTITFKYKALRESLSVKELTAFAETGQISSGLQFYLNAGKQNPDEVRKVLNRPVKVSVVTLDRALNNRFGEMLLDEMGRSIHPPAKEVSRQALRSALVLSARTDNQVTLLEVLQNYPTSEVEVEGEQLVRLGRQLSAISGRVRTIADDLNIF